MQQPIPFWALSHDALLRQLSTTSSGLTSTEARRRSTPPSGRNLAARQGMGDLWLLLAQFKSPIILLLLFAAGLSFALGERADAAIILSILVASDLLSFWQERGAVDTVRRLLATIQTRVTVVRDGAPLSTSRYGRRVSHGMVHGVGADRAADHAGHPHAAAVPAQ
jgi:Mg2+-importing ATPase